MEFLLEVYTSFIELDPDQRFTLAAIITLFTFHRFTWLKWTLVAYFFMGAQSSIIAPWLIITALTLLTYVTADFVYEKVENYIKFKYGRVVGNPIAFSWV